MSAYMNGPDDVPEMTDDDRTALTSDSGDISEDYQWEETVDVSDGVDLTP